MTKLVGILNITPDSFSDGGLFIDPQKAIDRAEQLFRDGADIIDVGAESTNPYSNPLHWQEEWSRLETVLQTLIPRYPNKISLDSYHPETIEQAFAIGPIIINDVTGMNNPYMIKTAVKHQARCIISHLRGDSVQGAHTGKLINDMNVVQSDLLEREAILIKKGIAPEHIVLDPGIGFGKTPELNRQLLRFASTMPGKSIMIGYSRKRFLGERRMELEPNLEAGRIAVESGASYLRVHDVRGHHTLVA